MAVEKFQITGMSCAACQANITRAVQKLPGVSEVNVSLLANQMTVEFDETAVTRGQIIDAVVKSGYGAQPFASGTREEGDDGGFRSEWNKRKKQEQDRSGWSVLWQRLYRGRKDGTVLYGKCQRKRGV